MEDKNTERMRQMERMKELAALLDRAARAYYQEDAEIMSNYTYDQLYDELCALERETGVTLSASPTARVGYEVLSELPRETHSSPMLSLDKTKSRQELAGWLGDQTGLLSWKLDGLTVVLTYEGGELVKAVTRGNGQVGEVITANARTFVNIPLKISYQERLTLRGEAVITYQEFDRINSEIAETDARYKNPRNLCSGSVRQLNSQVTAERNVRFYAFGLVEAGDVDFGNSRENQFLWMRRMGFEVVEYRRVTAGNIEQAIEDFAERIGEQEVPSDGLVLILDDIAYGQSLGRTAKFPRDSMAFKWADETRETALRYIEWSASRTGLINPVAVFEPVELEGTTVKRASVHNISILKALALGEGDILRVYKANMIIPQIAENLTRSDTVEIPRHCPVCGVETVLREVNDVQSLYCPNPDCQAKKIKSFALFVSRDAMNMDGLSEATLEKFIGAGFVHDFSDLYHLDRHREAIVDMEGFGEKSYERLQESIEHSRTSTLSRLIFALGIEGVGPATARLICRHYDDQPEQVRHAEQEELTAIDGIGDVIAGKFVEFFAKEENQTLFDRLLAEVELQAETVRSHGQIGGKTFVVTGSLKHFANRGQLKALIEERGGKVTGSVTGKTDYLINNDVQSTSSKNKKARELGIPIISEEEFMDLMGEE